MPLVLAAVAVIGTGVSAYEQNKAAHKAAAVDTATGDYNAKVDESQAQQLQLDTIQNIRTQRANNAVYTSQQEAAYASAGVLADSGSPLHAQIVTAGRMEQQLQQEYTNSQQRQQQLYSSAKIGRLEGAANATADRARGTLALVNGGVNIARQAWGDYESGVFSLGKKQSVDSGVGVFA